MKPETLKTVLGLLKPGQRITVPELRKKWSRDTERTRNTLDELAEVGLVERVEIEYKRTKHCPDSGARVGYILKWGPI